MSEVNDMADFESRMKNLEKDLDKLSRTFQELYPVDTSKGEHTWTAQQKMSLQILAMFANLKGTLSELNARLVVVESK